MNQIVSVLLGTSMFVGGVTGFILDNTIPGMMSMGTLIFMANKYVIYSLFNNTHVQFRSYRHYHDV